MRKLFDALGRGLDWRQTAAGLFPGGSLGNGAAMRAAPVGLLFHEDLERVEDEARRSAAVTHTHPVGIDGAVLVALGVALALRSAGGAFDAAGFFHELGRHAATEEFQWHLRTACRQSPGDSLTFGNGLEAHRSVTTALLCFAHSPDDYAGAASRAIAMGNDTDTLAAMAGALSGARLGCGVLPQGLLTKLEDGRKGRTYIRSVAVQLHELAAARVN
jgi:poly(ADP-ribose) glycohydrolase ARH3